MKTTAFSSLDLSPDLLAVIQELGYENLTPIQQQSIPLLLAGKDLVGQSKTGSGKTAAFTLPILQKIKMQQLDIQALILCPTRELCTQVAREIRRMGRRLPGLQVLLVCGGLPPKPQAEALAKGVHIVVGTPGRVLDHINRRRINLVHISTLVLDEADRMLDMGFEEDMTTIMDEVPGTRQTVFFSATFPPSMAGMSEKYQHEPARVTIEAESNSGPSIRQLVYMFGAEDKVQTLMKVLEQHQPQSAILFCNLKVTTTELASQLEKRGVSVAALNGDLEQFDRDRVMALFRNGSVRVLVATDVAARGLDIEDLEMVMNYDVPQDAETYTHRIGRTGRAGKTGLAISLAAGRTELFRLSECAKPLGQELEQATLDGHSGRPRETMSFLESKMQTLQVSGGRKDKVRPGDILGALTGDAGLSSADVGKIEIHDRLTYVAVSRSVAASALASLQNGKIKGRTFFVKIVT